jgi:hypothetical protein
MYIHKLEDVSHLQSMVVTQFETTPGRMVRKVAVEIKGGATSFVSLFFTHFLPSLEPFYTVKFF